MHNENQLQWNKPHWLSPRLLKTNIVKWLNKNKEILKRKNELTFIRIKVESEKWERNIAFLIAFPNTCITSYV